jgi:hypothetical protein
MLTNVEYEDLWNIHFLQIVPIGTTMPRYDEYIIRENMFQDYLDIFRGENTRGNIAIRPHEPAIWYYPHPFFNAYGTPLLGNTPCINNVLIAEAPPQVNGGVINYLYNVQLAGGAYITAPLQAFDINTNHMPTIDRLINLAQLGILIIDIFSFAINYNGIREDLNELGSTLDFFNNPHNPYSIENRINEIQELFCDDFNLNDRLNTAFIGPPQTSILLANYLNLHPHLFLNIRMGNNTFHVMHQDILPANFIYEGFPPGTNLVAVPGAGNYPLNVARVPILACTAYSGAYTVPSALFIKSALGLPL